MVNFDNMKFPKSPLKEKDLNAEQLKQFLTIRADYEKSAFVSEGHFEVRSLGAKEFVRPIPENECGITALLCHSSGHIYGGTSGEKAHLFYYNPAPDADACADAGIVWDGKAEITALLELANGSVLGVVNPADSGAKLFLYRPCQVLLKEKDFTGMGVREIFDLPAEDQLFFSTIDPCHSAGEIEILPLEFPEHLGDMLPVTGGGFCAAGAKSGKIYFADDALKNYSVSGQLDPNGNFSLKLGSVNGRIYGCGLYGKIFEVTAGGLLDTGCTAASLKGLELYNRVTAWCALEGVLYGGTADGLIFRFDPENNEVTTFGKPAAQSMVCGMAATGGKIYCIIGREDDCAHLTVYDPVKGSLRDLGCPLAHSERPWNGYVFASMCRGGNGQLFLGEFDRISQLFIYYPKID